MVDWYKIEDTIELSCSDCKAKTLVTYRYWLGMPTLWQHFQLWFKKNILKQDIAMNVFMDGESLHAEVKRYK